MLSSPRFGAAAVKGHLVASTRGHSTSMAEAERPTTTHLPDPRSALLLGFKGKKKKSNAGQVMLDSFMKKEIQNLKKSQKTTNLWKGVSIESWNTMRKKKSFQFS